MDQQSCLIKSHYLLPGVQKNPGEFLCGRAVVGTAKPSPLGRVDFARDAQKTGEVYIARTRPNRDIFRPCTATSSDLALLGHLPQRGRFKRTGNPSPTIEKACHSERRHSRSRRIYAPKDYSAETIMRRSFDALRLLRMTEEGRDICGHRWSPPPPLLLPLPLGEVPARSKGGEGTFPSQSR